MNHPMIAANAALVLGLCGLAPQEAQASKSQSSRLVGKVVVQARTGLAKNRIKVRASASTLNGQIVTRQKSLSLRDGADRPVTFTFPVSKFGDVSDATIEVLRKEVPPALSMDLCGHKIRRSARSP